MKSDNGPIIDMTPDGAFRRSASGAFAGEPAGLAFGTIILRLIAALLLIGLAVAIFWVAVFTLPLIFLGGIILYGLYRFQLMRHGRRPFGLYRDRNGFFVLRH